MALVQKVAPTMRIHENICRLPNFCVQQHVSANVVGRQLRDPSHKIGPTLQPVFISKKLEQDLKPKEAEPSIVNQQCVVYHFVCDLCDADYVGYSPTPFSTCC